MSCHLPLGVPESELEMWHQKNRPDTEEFDMHTAMIACCIYLSQRIFNGMYEVFWHGQFEGRVNIMYYITDPSDFRSNMNEKVHLEIMSITFTLAVYVVVRA